MSINTTNMKSRKLKSQIFYAIILICTLTTIAVLAALLISVFSKSIGWLNWNFLSSLPSRFPAKSGIKAGILGTLWVIGLTAIISFPLGIGAAIYLEEYSKKGWLKELIQINISNLAGVPSIIYGMLGLAVFVRQWGFGRSILSGALTMTILILPVLIVAAQEAIRSVPSSMRHGSYALGATQWQTITGVVLPYASSGILTGTILAIARAIGETAPMIMVGAAAFISFVPGGIMDSFTTIPLQIYSWTGKPQAEFQNVAAAGIVVLLAVLLLINSIAIILRNKYQDRVKS